jgi:hypothetical protein
MNKQLYIGPQKQLATILRESADSVTLLIQVETHSDSHEWTSTRRNFEARWKKFCSECGGEETGACEKVVE